MGRWWNQCLLLTHVRRYGDALQYELPAPGVFGLYDDGAWSVGGYDEDMLGLRSQGPFKRLKFAPALQRTLCAPMRDLVLRDMEHEHVNPAVQHSRDAVLR